MEGRVIVQFVIDELGGVRDPVVVFGIGAGCDEEAVKAVLQAASRREKAARVKMSLAITFKLT